MFGYGLLIGDIQVTVATPAGDRYFDGIQKVFPVGQFLAAGFSGHVELGYRLIDDLMRWLCLPPGEENTAWYPRWVVSKWRRRARWLHPRQAGRGQEAALMVCGVSPVEDNGIPGMARTWAWTLRSPEYDPEMIPWMRVASIGSGNNVERYQEGLQGVNDDPIPLLQSEVGGARGMFATTLGGILGRVVRDTPVPGVSPHFLICLVQRGELRVWPNDHDVIEEGGARREVRMPPIARTWAEVVALLRSNGIAESEAWRARG